MRERYLSFLSRNRDSITKILSLLIAIFLWYFIITEIDPTIKKDFSNVKVELRNQSLMREAGLELLKNEEYMTNIVVRGKRSAIVGLKEEDISAYVDLGEVEPGNHRLPIHVRLSDDSLTIMKTSPTAITIQVDEIVTLNKPVNVLSQGKPDDNYVLDRISVNPEEVSIKGPKEKVDKVQSVIGYISIESAKDTVISSVELTPVDQDKKVIEGLEVKPNSVGVQAVISKAVSVPIEVTYENDQVEGFKKERAILTPIAVMITGDREKIDLVKSIKTETVDARELMQVYTMPLNLLVPEGVHLVNLEESIVLRYMKNETARRSIKIPAGEVDVNGKSFKMPEEIDVEIYGEQNLVRSIHPEDMTLSVNADGTIKAKAPKGIEIIRLLPERLASDS